MPIVDLRQLSSRELAPLLSEEARHWREALYWDYQPSLDLVKKFVDTRSLAGCAAVEDGQLAGYCFYVLEEHKGLVGGLFVSTRFPQEALSAKLLRETLATLRATPRLQRVEVQLMPFGCALDDTLREQGFRLYSRQFMLLPLTGTPNSSPTPLAGLHPERWDDRYFDACARLIRLAYADHVDGEINDQYRSEAGALKFLRNIIMVPGCGQFQPQASFVLQSPGSERLVGVVLTSAVSPGVGHTTQICVLPGFQGHGLGRQLMEASIRALRAERFSALSLTVTSGNASAVQLYDHLGFRTIKRFVAGVWEPA